MVGVDVERSDCCVWGGKEAADKTPTVVHDKRLRCLSRHEHTPTLASISTSSKRWIPLSGHHG